MAEIKSSLVGHQNQWSKVKEIISSDLQSGSFLFYGPEGIGKKKMALALAQQFLCDAGTGCGHCGSCLRLENQKHEGVLLIDAEGDILKIEEAEKIKEFLKLKSLTRARFIVINDAHQMNGPTSNALLKTLEEPPEGVFFFLISSRVKGLLMTIKSRCRSLPFSILKESELEQVSQLNQYSLQNFRKSGQLHLVGKTQEKEFKPLVELACDILDNLAFDKFHPLVDGQKSLVKSKDQFLDLLTYLEIFIRDILIFSSGGGSEIYFQDYVQKIEGWSQYDRTIWTDFFESLSLKKEHLYLSPDSALFLESLIIDNYRRVN